MRAMILMAGAMLLAGCGGETKVAEATATKLSAGLYDVTAEVASLSSTDKSTPATKLKAGDKIATKACVGADGVPEPAMFAEPGDDCTNQSNYVRNGRMSVQIGCKRAGDNGLVSLTVGGKFTADSFDSEASTITGFYGDGDYRMTRKLSGKRVGNCPPAAPKAA